jgi:transposase
MPKRHKLTLKLQTTISQIRKGQFAYNQKDQTKVDFSRYNTAQINEIADVLDAIRNIVDLANQRIQKEASITRRPGRPSAPINDVVKVQLMESYFGISDRVSEGFLRLFREKLEISSDFCYKTIERGYDPERSKELLDEVLKITNEIGNSKEKKFSIDGTGDPCNMKVNYESKRAEQRKQKRKPIVESKELIHDAFPGKKHDFQYSVFTIGTTTKIIGGFATSDDHSRGELSFYEEVVEETIANCPSFASLCGDGLYANRVTLALIEEAKLEAFFLPRSNVTFRSKGVPLWKRMLVSLVEDPQRWLMQYHARSISESGNSMLKRREPRKISKKLCSRKAIQEKLKIDIHNIRQICYLKYLAPHLLRSDILGD